MPSPLPPIDLAARPAMELGDGLLQPSTLTLAGRDARATLEPRVMQVLVALADSTGSVVSRDALLQACWGGAVVGDDAVHRAVAGARRALREAGVEGCAIETIPRVGYRLVSAATSADGPGMEVTPPEVAPVEAVAAPVVSTASQTPLDAPQGQARSRSRRRVLVAGALTVTAATVASAWLVRRDAALPAQASALMEQGNQALRLSVPEAAVRGVDCFEQATRLAPQHAPAWGRLALARCQLTLFAQPAQFASLLAAVETSASRALALDSTQPDALTARALIVPAFGRWEQVERALQAVLDRHPDHLPALDEMTSVMASTGVVAAHYPLRLKTVTLDPLNAGYNFRAIYSHWMNQQIPAADLAGERGLELWPGHFPTWLARFTVFKNTGRATRALEMLGAGPARPRLSPSFEALLRLTATALASGADADRVAAREAVLHSVGRDGPYASVSATMDLAALGETSLALDVTEAYLLERGPLVVSTTWQPGQTRHDHVQRRFTHHLFLPVSASLRADPRFASIVRDIGLEAHWAKSGRPPDYHRGDGAVAAAGKS